MEGVMPRHHVRLAQIQMVIAARPKSAEAGNCNRRSPPADRKQKPPPLSRQTTGGLTGRVTRGADYYGLATVGTENFILVTRTGDTR